MARSLSEVYANRHLSGDNRGRKTVTGALFILLGVSCLLSAIYLATGPAMGSPIEQRYYGGILAGAGIPFIIVGIFIAIPAPSTYVIRGGIGALMSQAAVVWFSVAYPTQWYGDAVDYTLPIAMLFYIGIAISLWYVLSGVAELKARNNPEGDIVISVNVPGETRTLRLTPVEFRRYKERLGSGDHHESMSSVDDTEYVKSD